MSVQMLLSTYTKMDIKQLESDLYLDFDLDLELDLDLEIDIVLNFTFTLILP